MLLSLYSYSILQELLRLERHVVYGRRLKVKGNLETILRDSSMHGLYTLFLSKLTELCHYGPDNSLLKSSPL